MKCKFIYSSLVVCPDTAEWCNALKKIPRKNTSLDNFPSEEEQKEAAIRIGSIVTWNLLDGTTLLYVNSNGFSLEQEFSDQGYFILSGYDNCTEAELKKSFEMMEVDCASENGFIDKVMKKGGYASESREKIVKHISFMRKALDDNAKVIFSLLSGQERKAK